MHLRAAEVVKRPALFERLTGLKVAEFERLLEPFSREYNQQVIQPRLTAPGRVRASGGGQKGALPEMADKLLFILMYTRIYPLLLVQGMFFGMAESKACKWVGILLPILDAALGRSHVRPKRAQGRSLEEIIKEFPELLEFGVLTDGTERPIRRPKDPQEQKEAYSGKKKRHTKKHVTLTHPKTQYILATSEEANGSKHDKKVFDEAALRCTTPIPISARRVDSRVWKWARPWWSPPLNASVRRRGKPRRNSPQHKKSTTKDWPKRASALNTAMPV
jgi:hypothetical protein